MELKWQTINENHQRITIADNSWYDMLRYYTAGEKGCVFYWYLIKYYDGQTESLGEWYKEDRCKLFVKNLMEIKCNK